MSLFGSEKCPGCGEPVEAGWKVCPSCQLPRDVAYPRRPEDDEDAPPSSTGFGGTVMFLLVLCFIVGVIFVALREGIRDVDKRWNEKLEKDAAAAAGVQAGSPEEAGGEDPDFARLTSGRSSRSETTGTKPEEDSFEEPFGLSLGDRPTAQGRAEGLTADPSKRRKYDGWNPFGPSDSVGKERPDKTLTDGVRHPGKAVRNIKLEHDLKKAGVPEAGFGKGATPPMDGDSNPGLNNPKNAPDPTGAFKVLEQARSLPAPKDTIRDPNQ